MNRWRYSIGFSRRRGTFRPSAIPSRSPPMSAPKLLHYMQERDNNFNLVRFLAATAVLLSHCYPLTGHDAEEPLRFIGSSLGTIAVDVFFLVSGFLVTKSLEAREKLLPFYWARVVRIFPGLMSAILVCAFPIGLNFTALSTEQYLRDEQLFEFLRKNLVVLFGVRYQLPGLFETNPYQGVVNGSIWTLPWELKMYLLLSGIAFVFRARKRAGIAIIAAATMSWYLLQHFSVGPQPPFNTIALRLATFFFAGSLFYLVREHVNMDKTAFYGAASFLIGAAITEQQELFFVLYTLLLPYIVLYLAYVPGGSIRSFNRLGDYSYGIYIYAFPVQQVIVQLTPGANPTGLFLPALGVTLLFAAASWHLVEKPCLNFKRLS